MVKLALLWHMHQPYYEDLATGEHILPWVRLHAIKDYWGMVNMLEEFPGVHLTFNLVPSLLVQVQAFAEDRARDRHLQIGLKPATALQPEEVEWLVANGFHAPYERMIAPYPRYKELHAARHARRPFDVDALRDLQVWHKLAWMDPDKLVADERLLRLIEKGSRYSEEDKGTLRQVELEILRDVIPAYRRALDRGQVELSTSPFYHPILPLLCDSDIHLRAHPNADRPRTRFQRPDDARAQIHRALEFHQSVFGRRPAGLWPSEGSVSDEVVRLVNEAGLAWIATDEDILARSLELDLPRDESGHAGRADLLYRAYRLGSDSADAACVFRDHKLSDRIGFAYQSWDAEAAAVDFIDRVREAGRRFTDSTGDENAVVSVILDGENAWEHYYGGGRPFLRTLYEHLQNADDIQTVTMTEAVSDASTHLSSIFPGSWINADFYIWIGHRDDHRAWTQLAEARDAYDGRSGGLDAEARDRALRELQIAEGSDWFWWYGDDHSSDHDRDFDELFRRHLRNAYEALGSTPPAELYETNITTGGKRDEPSITVPGFSDPPTLDGRVTSALEWASAGRAPIGGGTGGTMHQVAGSELVSDIGVSVTSFGIGLKLSGEGIRRALTEGAQLHILVPEPTPHSVQLSADWIAFDQIVEAHVPFDALQSHPSRWNGRFAIAICDAADRVQERHPVGGYWSLVRSVAVRRAEWIV